MNLVDLQSGLTPTWLRRYYGRQFMRTLGLLKDDTANRARRAVLARMPKLAPADALASIASERGLVRAPGETQANFAQRLANAWDRWTWSGTAHGLLLALKDSGYPATLVATPKRTERLDANENAVISYTTWTTGDARWSGFEIVYAHPWPFTAPEAGNPASAPAVVVKTIIAAWKAAHSTLVRVSIYQGESWGDPPGTWGDAGTWGGTTSYYW